MHKRILMMILAVFALWQTAVAEKPKELLAKANAALEGKNTGEAIRLYNALLEQGFESVALYYNLGNAYFEKGDLGRAVLNYERALKIAPRDKDVLHNLEVIRKQHLANKIDRIPESAIERWWHNFLFIFSADTWAVLTILLFWISAVGFFFWLRGKSRQKRKKGFILGMAAFGISLLFLILTNNRGSVETAAYKAVVMKSNTIMRVAPDEQSKEEEQLFPGVTVTIVDTFGKWYEVRLSDGRKGWIAFSNLEKV